jgi:uncharacterized protein UPF0102
MPAPATSFSIATGACAKASSTSWFAMLAPLRSARSRRVEVTRSVFPAEAVTVRKQFRIRKLAGRWLSEHDTSAANLRFDVAAVLPDGRGGWDVDVITDAF